MELEIIVETTNCHPEFGGREKNMFRYRIDQGILASYKYKELKKSDCYYQHTVIKIVNIDNVADTGKR